ncbi:MAG: YajQ family cyclic di-GMP-binding protein [Thermomicrobiales bacterium]|nr:YajQ family cyclic di-GMP-binding protein [Thermomicrobiales bacterium]
MAQLSSFDVVSDFDAQEFRNALDQTQREIATRFDLKSTGTTIEHKGDELTIVTDSEATLRSVHDVLESKLIRRSLSLKILDYGEEEPASGGKTRQIVKLRKGIPEDLAKQVTKRIRDEFKKVTPQIQGDAIRVQAKNKDDLQAVIAALKTADYPVALQFTNYR